MQELSTDYAHGVTIGYATYNGEVFIGQAICHDDDRDMESRMVGETIALQRAELEILKYIRDVETKPVLNDLKELEGKVSQFKNCNQDSHEMQKFRMRIKELENKVIFMNAKIKKQKKDIRDYIELKEKYYKKIRLNRSGDNQKIRYLDNPDSPEVPK